MIRIKNAGLGRLKEVEFENIRFIEAVANTLKKEGIISEVTKEGGKLKIKLAYRKKEPVLLNLKLVSRPGLRIYMTFDDLSKTRAPFFFIVSTPKGVMSSYDAIKARLGGEILAKIW